MNLDAADLALLARALVHYRPSGEAAKVMDLLERIEKERTRRRVIAEELGPPQGGLISIPGGVRAAPRDPER